MAASVSGTYRNPAYQWQVSRDSISFSDISGAISTSYTRNPAGFGSFYYRMSVIEADNPAVSSCRTFSNVLSIRMDQNPTTRVSVNNPVCEAGKLMLQASGGAQYAWTGPNHFSADVPNPETIASAENTGKYYVTVSSPAGCKTTDSISLRVYPKLSVHAGPDYTICEGNSVVLTASQAVSYSWSPAAGLTSVSARSPGASPKDSTMYILVAKDVNGCTGSDTVSVHVLKKPVALVSAEVKIFAGQSAILKGETRGTNVQFYWSPATFMSNSNSLSPTVNPPDNITYTLNVVSNAGCGSARADVHVRILKTVTVPNAFSPNGDGINDVWNIEELQMYPDCELVVFNRYGAEVFRTKGYNKKWDGTVNGRPLPVGTYYYTLDLKTGSPVKSGWVLIVR
jgi:gliding motility-associated-like protein